MPDGNLLAQLLPANGPLLHSEFVAIDPLQFTELELPSFAVTATRKRILYSPI
ncbi:hypothetical protein ACFQMB_06955 [Pseudobowmanella zhangzhouensis]|uniref:hypothetical protein n=1 Tax=Pseudobowmanella zhangzhouensis TaxID=1537679 RepID=UPI0036162C7A